MNDHVSGDADIGVVGLAVMGQNLVLNLADNGFAVAVFNRTSAITEAFLSGEASEVSVIGTWELRELVAHLRPPRKVLLMVQAGDAVDAVLEQLLPLLSPGDIVIDGGNSHFVDTQRRLANAEASMIHYVGAGISGGEEGARLGPAIMPGGAAEAWPEIRPMLEAVSAQAHDGTPCCGWLGDGGSGHFVKMVHNGIEYADMQVIAEAYSLLRAVGHSHDEMATIFRSWGAGVLDSFLIDVTADVLSFRDEDGHLLVPSILDVAAQKGTGRWTLMSALDLGQPTSVIAEAVLARMVSSLKEERRQGAMYLTGPQPDVAASEINEADIHDATYAAKIICYAQGFMLLSAASEAYAWKLDLSRIASIWRGGCIIRARLLDDIVAALGRDPRLANLMVDPFFAEALASSEAGLRRTVAHAAMAGVAVPAYSSALAFYDAMRCETGPANLIQAQRDYFGAHTYERTDRARGESFHTDWTAGDGISAAGTFNA